MLNLTLPLPPRACSPNGDKGSWRAKYAAGNIYRTEAWATTSNRLLESKTLDLTGKRLTIALTFCTKGSRGTGRYAPRDCDNAVASAKSAIDGITDALGVPDTYQWLSLGSITITNKRGPWVEVVLEEMVQ